jgi:hypothetical protein
MNDKLVRIATHKVVKDDVFRELSAELEVGQHIVDCSVRLRGALKKGAPFRSKVAAAANPWRLLAVALSKLNSASVETIVKESLSGGDEEASAVKAAADEAIQRIVAATERESSGRITGEVVLELL